VWLSPDETLLYYSEFSTGQVGAAFFDSTTGVISSGCTSNVLKGYNVKWSFLAGLATAIPNGLGGGLFVAEPDASIGLVRASVSGASCSFQEAPLSPFNEGHTITLDSIGVFPPRPF
jgi:hypothetical protein